MSSWVAVDWYQITMPPCSRLWITCDSTAGLAVVYTPQLAGVVQCWPDVAGTLLYGPPTEPFWMWPPPSSTCGTPTRAALPPPKTSTMTSTITPSTRTPPTINRRQSMGMAPPRWFTRFCIAASLARPRRWTPAVRRLLVAIGATG